MTRALYFALLILFTLGCFRPAAADIRHGLDQRPSNTTCLAPALALANPNVEAVVAFPNFKFNHPISLDQPSDNPDRWFVAQRGGVIRTFTNDPNLAPRVALNISSYLDATDQVGFRDSQEWGITSIALHPQFSKNGYMYVAYNYRRTPTSPITSVVSRFTAGASKTTFDPGTDKVLLTIEQTAALHHIGQLQFGLDGYLYISSGDGSLVLPDTRTMRAQDPFDLHGKILRIDVDHGDPYAVPADNPYASGTLGAPEVYALGFRNPWRFSIDRKTGEIWEGDVGQDTREEINHVVKGGNYGWPIYEGSVCRQKSCNPAGLTPPTYEFVTRENGAAVIGGAVYRGSDIPALDGVYIFGAVFSASIAGLDPASSYGRIEVATVPRSLSPSSFGQDARGEIYIINGQTGNKIFKLVPKSGTTATAAASSPVASRLSQTGCVNPDNPQEFAAGVIPYDVNMLLWSDGADKTRGMALPNSGTIGVNADGDYDFPARTVLIKMFSFAGRPHETRLFMRHPNGEWRGYTYEWRADLSDADLLTDGKTKTIANGAGGTVNWTYPSPAQCLECHNEAAGFSLGLETAQLNRDFVYPSTGRSSNQIATLDHIGMYSTTMPPFAELPALASRYLTSTSMIRRARSYLHANCALCHRPDGLAQTTIDFRYSTATDAMNICDAAPIAGNLGVADAKLLAPGDPAHSIIPLRMRRLNTYRMPPIGTGVVDSFILRTALTPWINRADVCAAAVDTDGDGVPNNADNCIRTFNPDQADDDRDGYGNACDGDLNNDLKTDAADLSMLTAALGKRRNDPGFIYRADLNHDLIIDAADRAILQGMMGKAPGPSALRP
ncbi:MAG: PQQ-dependent sugar dehydrogenase [Rhodospirillales bacterium]|nr:PQQ-dependent sugar dehydrogenase [Rhodospirillales bacterium]